MEMNQSPYLCGEALFVSVKAQKYYVKHASKISQKTVEEVVLQFFSNFPYDLSIVYSDIHKKRQPEVLV